MSTPSPYVGYVDLVLEGGGVKGIGLAGAISQIRGTYPKVQRVAGTSAGAIVASLVAAGFDDAELYTTMNNLDFSQFEQKTLLDRVLGVAGKGMEVLLHEGIYRTDNLHAWIAKELATKGVHTWADLKYTDPALPQPQYKLVVIVSDISRGRMLRLPWDYAAMGLDPDTISVADAVTASASIPFYFRAAHLTTGTSQGDETLTLVDGGCLSNYPIDVFDRQPCQASRWPTIGVKLSSRQAPAQEWHAIHNPAEMVWRLVDTMVCAHDNSYVDEPSVQDRTVFVDTTNVSATNFNLDAATKQQLYTSGQSAGTDFMATWDWPGWQQKYCPPAS